MIVKLSSSILFFSVSIHVAADFIIVPNEQRAIPTPIEVSGQSEKLIEPGNYTKINRISKPLIEIGTPIDTPFKPEVYASSIELESILPELLPNELAIYIHDAVSIKENIAYSNIRGENWRGAIERFAKEKSLTVMIDWTQRLAEVIPNGARISKESRGDMQIQGPDGSSYIIRPLEQDHLMSKQSGFLFVNGKAIRFDSAK